MSYYITPPQRARLTASVGAIESFVQLFDDIVESDDFNPNDLLTTLENIYGEVVFLQQYINTTYLTGDNPRQVDQSDE